MYNQPPTKELGSAEEPIDVDTARCCNTLGSDSPCTRAKSAREDSDEIRMLTTITHRNDTVHQNNHSDYSLRLNACIRHIENSSMRMQPVLSLSDSLDIYFINCKAKMILQTVSHRSLDDQPTTRHDTLAPTSHYSLWLCHQTVSRCQFWSRRSEFPKQ